MLHPPTPPPIITARACARRSDIGGDLSQALLETLILDPIEGLGEVPAGIPVKVKIECGNTRLNQSPHRLAKTRHDLHEIEPRQLYRSCRSKVIPEKETILSHGEIMV